MKKLLVGACIACSLILLSGCAAKPSTSMARDSYQWHGEQTENSAQLKTVVGIGIWSLDGERIVGFGGRKTALYLTPGEHRLIGTYNGRDMRVGTVNYEAGHEYLLDMISYKDRTYYWVEDLTAGKVVFGNKKTKDDFVKKK